MVPKKKRVTKDVFQTIMKHGGALSSSLFSLRYMPAKTLSYAVVAPKNVAKQAHIRNTLRRRGYAILAKYPLKSGLFIFFYKKEARNKPFSEIKDDINTLLSKIRL